MIVLEEIYKNEIVELEDGSKSLVKVYVGRIEISEDEFQAIFKDIKKDKTDEMGYRKYKKVLKEQGFDIE